MTEDFKNAALLALCFLTLFAIGEIMYHVLKVKPELTRKWSHLGTGLLTMLFPIMLSNHWWVLALCSSFMLLLLLSIKFNFLKSINAVDRETVGSILYPISVYICFLVYTCKGQMAYFYLPILILAISDPIAALIGKTWPIGKFNIGKIHKTLIGSASFFISAVVLTLFTFTPTLATTPFKAVTISIIIALIATIVEAFSTKGYDNLTIPLAVLASLYTIPYSIA